FFFFFQAEDGIRDRNVTGVQTCALPISDSARARAREAYPSSARRFSAVRSGRIPARGDCRDAGDFRGGVQKHAVSGEEKLARNAGTAAKQRGVVAVNQVG